MISQTLKKKILILLLQNFDLVKWIYFAKFFKIFHFPQKKG